MYNNYTMFERFFDISKNPEQIEKHLKKLAEEELTGVVNAPSMNLAFDKIKRENKSKAFGLTDEQLLEIVKDTAVDLSTPVEDFFYGGHKQTIKKIELEIEHLRQGLTKEKNNFKI